MLELRGPDRNLSREVGGGRKEKYALPPPLKVVKTVFLRQSVAFIYSGRRLYQYNDEDFLFQFRLTAWMHINIEVKRSCQSTKLLFNYL